MVDESDHGSPVDAWRERVRMAGIMDHGCSPIADNIVLLRYVEKAGISQPSLSVVKTRGSAHSFRPSEYVIAKGGLRIMRPGQRDARAVSPVAKRKAGKMVTRPKRSRAAP